MDEHSRIIEQQHTIMLDVMFEYQRSRWPWVRWVAEKMHKEMMYRCALAEQGQFTPGTWSEVLERMRNK